MSLNRDASLLSSSSSSEEDQANQANQANQAPRQDEEGNGLNPLMLMLLLRYLINGLNSDGLGVQVHMASPVRANLGMFSAQVPKFNYSFNDGVTLEVKKHPQPNFKHYHAYIKSQDNEVEVVLYKEQYLPLKSAIQNNNQQEVLDAIRNINPRLIEEFKLDALSNRPNLGS